MTVKVFVGSGFGDEGKAKVIDYYSKDADMVCRYAGGNNAGHTVVVNDDKFIFKLIPSGILYPDVHCVLGSGMVIDPVILGDEIRQLEQAGISLEGRLFISDKAHVIMPKHKEEDAQTGGRIGTTKKGIGPAYQDKIARTGLRLRHAINRVKDSVDVLYGYADSLLDYRADLLAIEQYVVPNVSTIVNMTINNQKNVFLEGAQGTMLDIDHGSYPYVTSSNCTAGGACTGLGVPPTKVDEVIGITKAYMTRVGNGPFPTELNGEIAEHIRDVGHEYGSVTGRPRRVGWLDLPMLQYAAMINGFTSLAVTKLDVLRGLDMSLGVSYNGSEFDPDDLHSAEPIYRKFDSFAEDLTNVDSYDKLPDNAKKVLDYIEYMVEVPIKLVSVGPQRHQTFEK